MALNTPKSLRNKIVYEVYVRNHGKTGKFSDVARDLIRIRELGADILLFMPIHPIGIKNRKGTLGCPYSVRDFTKVNPEYGTEDDFKKVIELAHKQGLQVMIDIVFNHTAHDCVYTETNPEFYCCKENGGFGGKIADWSDVIDLNYSVKELWEAQISALKKWALLGVDGFRCDIAPFVPVSFWAEARRELSLINPNLVWLAETVHPSFLQDVRAAGQYCASDSQDFEVFDMTYDYDTQPDFLDYLEGKIVLEELLEKKRAQEYTYPDNYVKLRFIENHDNPRAKAVIPTEKLLYMWTAFMFFEKGAVLLYSGQEAMDAKLPSLFDKDAIDWSGLNDGFVSFIKNLVQIKQQGIFADGVYRIHKATKKGVIFATYTQGSRVLAGIFNVESKMGDYDLTVRDRTGEIKLTVPDGIYGNMTDGSRVEVREHKIRLSNAPVMFLFTRQSSF